MRLCKWVAGMAVAAPLAAAVFLSADAAWSFNTKGWVFIAPAVADEAVYIVSCSEAP